MGFDKLYDGLRKVELTLEDVRRVEALLQEARLYLLGYLTDPPLGSLTDQELRAKVQLNRIQMAQAVTKDPYELHARRLQHELDRRSLGRGSWPVGLRGYYQGEGS